MRYSLILGSFFSFMYSALFGMYLCICDFAWRPSLLYVFPNAEPFTPSLPRPNLYFAEASAESEDEMIHPGGVASLLPPDFQSSLERPELELSRHSPSTYLPPHCALLSILRSWWGEVVMPPFMLNLHESLREIPWHWYLTSVFQGNYVLFEVCFHLYVVLISQCFEAVWFFYSSVPLQPLVPLNLASHSLLWSLYQLCMCYTSSHPPKLGTCYSLLVYSTNFFLSVVCLACARHQESAREKAKSALRKLKSIVRGWTFSK